MGPKYRTIDDWFAAFVGHCGLDPAAIIKTEDGASVERFPTTLVLKPHKLGPQHFQIDLVINEAAHRRHAVKPSAAIVSLGRDPWFASEQFRGTIWYMQMSERQKNETPESVAARQEHQRREETKARLVLGAWIGGIVSLAFFGLMAGGIARTGRAPASPPPVTVIAKPTEDRGEVWVRPYCRDNGEYVEGHYRTRADGTTANNWSVRPNVNPHTGEAGRRRN